MELLWSIYRIFEAHSSSLSFVKMATKTKKKEIYKPVKDEKPFLMSHIQYKYIKLSMTSGNGRAILKHEWKCLKTRESLLLPFS